MFPYHKEMLLTPFMVHLYFLFIDEIILMIKLYPVCSFLSLLIILNSDEKNLRMEYVHFYCLSDLIE